LAGYALADRIVVGSYYAADSFAEHGELTPKLFRNPYGVDCEKFADRERAPPRGDVRLIFVGTWSLRKGCDLLAEAIKRVRGVILLHVGRIGDAHFPSGDKRFCHYPPVSQSELPQYYAKADAAVLFSREDGFGIVIAQALASGLPVICSTHTGARDLATTSALCERILLVPSEDIEALTERIKELSQRLRFKGPFAPLCPEDRYALSWAAYGRRYANEIQNSFG
jgi:glycosyltransferase involved in cell wall biosynthesis